MESQDAMGFDEVSSRSSMKGNEMDSEKSLIVFQDKKISRLWHDDEWFYSVSDIIAILTDSKDELACWRKLKQREPQLVTICHGLKLPAADGKLRYEWVKMVEGDR